MEGRPVHVNCIVKLVSNLQVRVKKDEKRWTVLEKVIKDVQSNM